MDTCTIDDCTRPHRARGYCASHYNKILAPNRHLTTITCANPECGKTHTTTRTNGKYCTHECYVAHARATYAPPPPKPREPEPPADQRGPLRRAVEDGDHAATMEALESRSQVTPSGCWEWPRVDRHGYPVAWIGRQARAVHRLALEAKLGRPLGSQPAHHVCANPRCVNPAHLQPVTHRDNVAEMLARNYMVGRIEALEAALAVHSPEHPLLREIGLPKGA